MSTLQRLFISAVTDEFGSYRRPLCEQIERPGVQVEIQEKFLAYGDRTLPMLDAYVSSCAAVVHLAGDRTGNAAKGGIASTVNVDALLALHPDLQVKLGVDEAFLRTLSYTQWEAWLAVYHGRKLFIAPAEPEAPRDTKLSDTGIAEAQHASQQAHLAALRKAGHYPADQLAFESSDKLIIAILRALHDILPPVRKPIPHLGKLNFFHNHAAESFLGREPQLALLDKAWADGTNVLSIIAWGGVGKTALLCEWIDDRFIKRHWHDEEGKPLLAAYFDWTFYDQGTRYLADGTEARTGSVGDFFEQALVFFGDPDPNLPGKGRRLADLIRQQRSLIILDGLEPLQHPPGHPQTGRLLDPDLRDLLAALAQSNRGLCLITSRQALTDLHSLRRTVHKEHELEDLPVAIATRLLRKLHIKGTDQELAEASEKFGCHALSLTLLGRYLFDAHGGDIRKLDRIDLKRADDLTRDTRQRTIWRILETYESWLATAQADGNPKTLAVLRLAGLFDRTATGDCLAALCAEPIIPGLTDAICGMADDEWNILLKRLERTHLIKLRESSDLKSSSSVSAGGIDAHPLIREYFGNQLKQTQPEAFKAAHSRLFDHLCSTTNPDCPSTAGGLQPLYQAIAHGCQSGRHREALAEVFERRIMRGTDYLGHFSSRVLGNTQQDRHAVELFFDEPHNEITPHISESDQVWLVAFRANYLRASGQVHDALSPLRATARVALEDHRPKIAMVRFHNLSEVELLLGMIGDAVIDTQNSVTLADYRADLFERSSMRSASGNALHSAGELNAAGKVFEAAEEFQREAEPNLPLMYSLQGFMMLDFRLRDAERGAWSSVLACGLDAQDELDWAELGDHASRILQWARLTSNPAILDIASARLTLARMELYRRLLPAGHHQALLETRLSDVVAQFRQANRLDHFPKALLTAAFYNGTLGENLEEAERLLEEAQQIAERGPMPLYLADVHLHRARLFGRMNADERKQKFPDIDPKAELAKARTLIEKHGYWRRKEELEDAEAAAMNW